MAHRARIIALAALLAFTMAACTTSTDIAQRAESSTPSRASTTSLEATKEAPRGTEQKSSPSKRHLTRLWVNTEHHAVSGVTNIAGVAVFYEHVGGSLFITGLDPQSGTTLWSHLASPGDVAPGIAIQVAEVGDKVAYLEPVERYTPKDFESMLVLANARTGATVNQSGPGYFFDRPSACDHRPAQVCSQGRVGNRDDVRTYRLGTSGGLRPVRNQLPGDYSGIGPHGLVGDQGETDDHIGVARHGHLIWSRRVSKLFGAGFRTIAGWGFWYDDASGLIVGTVGYYVPGLYRYHLKRMNQTVGLRPESGEVVWRRRGSDPFCHPDRADEPGLGDFPLLACTWTSGVVIYPHHPKS
ncbi:MAG: hypothetical protein ACRDQA_00595, partial [Nocardioidaceae bacterium]